VSLVQAGPRRKLACCWVSARPIASVNGSERSGLDTRGKAAMPDALVADRAGAQGDVADATIRQRATGQAEAGGMAHTERSQLPDDDADDRPAG
jgi:hypothetical protein